MADIEDDFDKTILIRGSLGLDHRRRLESAMVQGVNAITIEPNKGVQP